MTAKKTASASGAERLQKVLARAGHGSRRGLEARMERDEIMVNGRAARPGLQVKEGDQVELDGKRFRVELEEDSSHRVILYNKPEGVVCTRSDPEGRPTVFDKLPVLRHGRWIAIGRLDINTTGLLMFTTDGELANAMMHPSSGVDREYACRVHGEVTGDMLQQLRDGVQLEDGEAHFTDIVDSGGSGENHWFHVCLMEGRNREVRRLWEAVGVQVSRLKRVRYGAVFMPSRLKVGRWEELPARDVRVLREDAGLKARAGSELVLKSLGRSQRSRSPGRR